jgi:hypothetical protein
MLTHHRPMLAIEPNATQHRNAALALIIVAALTATMLAVQWVASFDGPLLLPVTMAYFVFNFGYIVGAIRGRLYSKGARLGSVAALLNLLAMLLGDFPVVWTALSLCAVVAALIASVLLFADARRAAA